MNQFMSDTMQQTLSILKPDATERNITGAINRMIEESGLKIVAQRRVQLTLDQAKEFYDMHKDRPFFSALCHYMVCGPVVLQVLEGHNAVEAYRKLMGATNPHDAEEGTIRKVHGKSIDENSVHGSDSLENAQKEIVFFFKCSDIIS